MSSKKPKMSKDKSIETLKRVLDYIAAYRWAVCLSLLLALVTVAFTLYIPILTGKAVDEIVSQGNVDFSALISIIKKIIMAMAATAISQWLMNHINNIITYRVVKDIRTKAFGHLEVLPLSYIDSHPSGDIISRIIADIDQFSEGLLMGFTQFFTGLMTILGTLLFMVSINPLITLVVVVLTPISLFVASFIAKKTYVMFKHQSETRGELTTLTDEMLGNMKVVQAFGYQKEAEERFQTINNKLAGYSLRATFFSSITNPATRFVNSLVYAAVGITGAYAAIRGFMTVGQLTSFLSYANQYTKPFNEISGVVTELQNALASAARVFELIDEAHLDNKDVWKRANLDRKHFSKIQCDQNYHPKKKTVMALCIALQLDLEQSKDLLARADWAFSPSSKVDLIVQKAIIDKQYDIMQLNVILFKYTNEILGV